MDSWPSDEITLDLTFDSSSPMVKVMDEAIDLEREVVVVLGRWAWVGCVRRWLPDRLIPDWCFRHARFTARMSDYEASVEGGWLTALATLTPLSAVEWGIGRG